MATLLKNRPEPALTPGVATLPPILEPTLGFLELVVVVGVVPPAGVEPATGVEVEVTGDRIAAGARLVPNAEVKPTPLPWFMLACEWVYCRE